MPRISFVNKQASPRTAGKPTLRKLQSGETFRFPNSRSGKVYQKVEGSERAQLDYAFDCDYAYIYSDLSTGQIFGDMNDQEVVPVVCSMNFVEKE